MNLMNEIHERITAPSQASNTPVASIVHDGPDAIEILLGVHQNNLKQFRLLNTNSTAQIVSQCG